MNVASSNDFVTTWAAALNLDPTEVRRVVIDAQAGHAIVIHVEKYGSRAMLDIDPVVRDWTDR